MDLGPPVAAADVLVLPGRLATGAVPGPVASLLPQYDAAELGRPVAHTATGALPPKRLLGLLPDPIQEAGLLPMGNRVDAATARAQDFVTIGVADR
jgi:hypothetical protein